jgi:hypothetical protein
VEGPVERKADPGPEVAGVWAAEVAAEVAAAGVDHLWSVGAPGFPEAGFPEAYLVKTRSEEAAWQRFPGCRSIVTFG